MAKSAHLRRVPRIIIPASHAFQLAKYDGLIEEILNWLHYVRTLSHVTYTFIAKELAERRIISAPHITRASIALARFANSGAPHLALYPPGRPTAKQKIMRLFEGSPALNPPTPAAAAAVQPPPLLFNQEEEAPVEPHTGLQILVQGAQGEWEKERFLGRIEGRGRDAEVRCFVYCSSGQAEGEVEGKGVRRWVSDMGVLEGRVWLEEWA